MNSFAINKTVCMLSLLLTTVLLPTACETPHSAIIPGNEEEKKEQLDFQLSEATSIQINSLPQDTRCQLFTTYPFDEEGELTAEAVMIAYAPVNKRIYIPKSVTTLYVYANGKLYTYANGNLTLVVQETKAQSSAYAPTRAGEEQPGNISYKELSEAFITAAYAYYPEGRVNLSESERLKSTDLVAPEGDKIENGVNVGQWGKTKIWITYVGNGGTNFAGSLWYYTYKTDGTNYTPATTLPKHTLLFDNSQNIQGRRVYLGEFEPGTRIGFIYKGNTGVRYSTPHYNNISTKTNVANGVIRRWQFTENGTTTEYATLGMENRLPHEASWDGDYNDMICLIEADPLFIENELPKPERDPEVVTWGGYWLFEDNYPYEGDYDFNDLVVKYAIKEYKNEAVIDLEFAARGASYKNSFGVNGSIYFENLSGFENVYAASSKVTRDIQQIRLPLASNYIPMLHNGRTSFNQNTYNEHNSAFPNILVIPVVNKSNFQWDLEGIRIDEAYPRYKEWVNSKCKSHVDWYLDTPAEGKVWNK